MKMTPLLLLLALVFFTSALHLTHGLERVDRKGTRLRQLQEQPGGMQENEVSGQYDQREQPETLDAMVNEGGDDTESDYDESGPVENVHRCFPGSWNWPRCRYGGGGRCYPGSWNWPRCRFGGGNKCFPGSWNWPRCRYKW